MHRRTFAVLGGLALTAPLRLLAQPAKRVYRIATLDEGSEKAHPHDWAVLRGRLRELGFSEGGNAVYVSRFADGQNERLPALAGELVAAKPDIIICSGTPAARAALRATASIPIVFIAPGDPVGTGLVASLARPGGNATGFSTISPEVAQKSFEILREIVPDLKRIGYLTDPSNPATHVTYSRLEESARKLKVSSRMLDAVGKVALERSFDTIRRERLQGLIVGASSTVLDYRDQIVQFAAREKLPAVYTRREYVDAGGLVSHGIHRVPLYIRSAELVYRVLQGAKPAEIPVEQIAAVRTVLNLKAAKALGIKIPESLKLRVDEVVE